MKVLLVRPSSPQRAIGAAHASLCEPLELEVLAGNLRDHDVTVLDMRVDATPLDQVLEAIQPDVVGVTANTMEVLTARAVLRRVKEVLPAVGTVVGGPHATARPEDFAGSIVKAIVIGQGVATFREVVEAREQGLPLEDVPGLVVNTQGKQVRTAPRRPAATLSEFPPPDRHTTSSVRGKYYHAWAKPVLLVQGSSGATHPGTVGAPPRDSRIVQEVEQIAAEMVELDGGVCLADDDALAESARIARLCALLKEASFSRPMYLCSGAQAIVADPEIIEDLAELGLVAVALALDCTDAAGPPPEQRRAVEILHANGVGVSGELIADPDFDRDQLQRLGRLAEELKIEFPLFSTPTPFPGTSLYEERRESLGTPDWELFDRVHCVLPTRLPLRAFYAELAHLYERAYGLSSVPRMSGSVPWRHLPALALQLHRFTVRVRHAYIDQEPELHRRDGKRKV
jgi:radical SAM superfamily enzyme YgiQ (UPF0313 family)